MKITYVSPTEHLKDLKKQLEAEKRYMEVAPDGLAKLHVEREIKDLEYKIKCMEGMYR